MEKNTKTNATWKSYVLRMLEWYISLVFINILCVSVFFLENTMNRVLSQLYKLNLFNGIIFKQNLSQSKIAYSGNRASQLTCRRGRKVVPKSICMFSGHMPKKFHGVHQVRYAKNLPKRTAAVRCYSSSNSTFFHSLVGPVLHSSYIPIYMCEQWGEWKDFYDILKSIFRFGLYALELPNVLS